MLGTHDPRAMRLGRGGGAESVQRRCYVRNLAAAAVSVVTRHFRLTSLPLQARRGGAGAAQRAGRARGWAALGPAQRQKGPWQAAPPLRAPT